MWVTNRWSGEITMGNPWPLLCHSSHACFYPGHQTVTDTYTGEGILIIVFSLWSFYFGSHLQWW